jgi:hypothetical protein
MQAKRGADVCLRLFPSHLTSPKGFLLHQIINQLQSTTSVFSAAPCLYYTLAAKFAVSDVFPAVYAPNRSNPT